MRCGGALSKTCQPSRVAITRSSGAEMTFRAEPRPSATPPPRPARLYSAALYAPRGPLGSAELWERGQEGLWGCPHSGVTAVTECNAVQPTALHLISLISFSLARPHATPGPVQDGFVTLLYRKVETLMKRCFELTMDHSWVEKQMFSRSSAIVFTEYV